MDVAIDVGLGQEVRLGLRVGWGRAITSPVFKYGIITI